MESEDDDDDERVTQDTLITKSKGKFPVVKLDDSDNNLNESQESMQDLEEEDEESSEEDEELTKLDQTSLKAKINSEVQFSFLFIYLNHSFQPLAGPMAKKITH